MCVFVCVSVCMLILCKNGHAKNMDLINLTLPVHIVTFDSNNLSVRVYLNSNRGQRGQGVEVKRFNLIQPGQNRVVLIFFPEPLFQMHPIQSSSTYQPFGPFTQPYVTNPLPRSAWSHTFH